MSSVDDWISTKKDYEQQVIQLDQLKITKISPQLRAQLQKFKLAKRLSFIGCDLRSFENFPTLQQLQELDLTDNKIKGEELKNLPLIKNLREISLSSNPIANIQDIKALVKFNKTLMNLFLEESQLANSNKNYRKEVFQIIGGALVNVDLEDREGKEIVEESEGEEFDDEDDDEGEDEEEFEDEEEEEGEKGKRTKPKTPQGKKQQNSDEEDEDDEEEDQDDDFDDDGDEDDDEDQSENSEPVKKTKRS